MYNRYLCSSTRIRFKSESGAEPAISSSEATDHFSGAFASWWRASSVSNISTNIAACKRIEDMVKATENKVPHVSVYGQISCAVAAIDEILADVGRSDGTVPEPFHATSSMVDLTSCMLYLVQNDDGDRHPSHGSG